MIENTEIIVIDNKLYGICNKCNRLVRINKPIIGSLHLCN